MTVSDHPSNHRLSCLAAPWKPGQSGNPIGRPNAGASMREWMNLFQDWPEEEIRAIADDKNQPIGRRTAARSCLRALSDGYFNATPLAANDLDRIFDRTHGKPIQPVEITQRDRDPATIMSDLQALMRADPALAAQIEQMLPVDALAAHLPSAAHPADEPTT